MITMTGVNRESFADTNTDRWEMIQELGKSAFDKADFKLARKHFGEALSLAEQLGLDESQLISSMEYLVLVAIEQGRYMDAIVHLKRTLGIYENQSQPNVDQFAETLETLALMSRELGDPKQALHYAEQAYQKRLHSNPPDPVGLASSLPTLGGVNLWLGFFRKSESYYLKSLDAFEQHGETNHPDMGRTWNDLGILYQQWGRYTQAEQAYRQSLKIQRQIQGDQILRRTVVTWTNLATSFMRQGRIQEAEHLIKNTLDTASSILLPNDVEIAKCYYILGTVAVKQNRLKEGQELLERALDMLKETVGEGHPFSSAVQLLLADAYLKSDKPDLAQASYQTALENMETSLGKSHPDNGLALIGLAKTRLFQKQYMDATRLYKKAIEL